MQSPEEKISPLRPHFESFNSMTQRLGGIGPTKGWELVKEGRVEVVYLDRRTLVVVESTDRLAAQLRAEAASREPSDWSRRCGLLASAANKGRRRALAKEQDTTPEIKLPHKAFPRSKRQSNETADISHRTRPRRGVDVE
jgi:hypothetical protein